MFFCKIKTYVTDFPDRSLVGRPNVLLLPHLGASTKEAETNCAQMVSRSIRSFLENGNIYNSVNFPEVHLDRKSGSRLSVTNQNQPNMVGQFTTCLGEAGININDLSVPRLFDKPAIGFIGPCAIILSTATHHQNRTLCKD